MKIYLIGIAGAGMHSLALYLFHAGHEISGSDPGASQKTCDFWKAHGVTVHRTQTADNIHDIDMAVCSAAVPQNNPERKAAQALGILCTRGECLARFANAFEGTSIAVCGTHGKGTTAGAISAMLTAAGRKVSDILGAVPVGRIQPSKFSQNAEFLVSEVDESDRTNGLHRPKLLILNNIEEDHLNTYRDLNDIVVHFAAHIRACLNNPQSKVLLHHAGIGAPKLHAQLKDWPGITWVCENGALETPAFSYELRTCSDGTCDVRITEHGAQSAMTEIHPRLVGRANAQNIAVAFCAGRLCGIPAETARLALEKYEGLKDRCQKFAYGQKTVYTDYASHPTCVRNDIDWVRQQTLRHLIAIYHPYRYSLMQYHWDALIDALSYADCVLLPPLDGAGEPPAENISSELMAQKIEETPLDVSAMAFDSFESLEAAAKQLMHDGDSLIVFGGGPLFDMGHRIASARPERENQEKQPDYFAHSRTPSLDDLSPNACHAAWTLAIKSLPQTFDLSISNPTKVGLPQVTASPDELQAALSAHYEASPQGLRVTREAIAHFYKNADPDRIQLFASTSEAIGALIKLFCQPGDEVITCTPTYPLLDCLTSLECVRLREVPLQDCAGIWSVDFWTLAKTCTQNTKIMIAVSPNNPTGHCIPKREMQNLVVFCARRGIVLIIDEVFASYKLNHDPELLKQPAASDAYEGIVISLSGLSKVCGQPQHKLGWALFGGNPALVEEAMQRLQFITDSTLSVSGWVQRMAPIFIKKRQNFVAPCIERMKANLDYLRARARREDVQWRVDDVDGGWSVVLRLPGWANDEDIAAKLAADGVRVFPGSFFGYRVNQPALVLSLITPENIFAQGVERMAERLKAYL